MVNLCKAMLDIRVIAWKQQKVARQRVILQGGHS
jgi:hypothetical protein